MKAEASIKLSEIEDNKRYSILARAIMLCLKGVNITCHIDIKAEDDNLKVYVENEQ